MKTFKSILKTLFAFSLILFIVSCNNPVDFQTTEQFTVEYSSEQEGAEGIPENLKVESGTKLTKKNLPTPILSGYEFLGWFIDKDPITSDYEVTKNIKLVAKWKIIESTPCTVQYYVKGKLFKTVPNISKGATIETLPNPKEITPDEYFDGWYIGDKKVGDTLTITEDTTIFAKFEKYVSIKFIDQNQKIVKELTKLKKGTVLTEKDIPTMDNKDNEVFVGWYSGDDTIISSGYTISSDIVATPKWGKYFVVSFDNLKGTTKNPIKVELDKNTITIDDLHDVHGYIFDGWYNGENKLTSNTITVTQNIVLTAHWTPITYKINYHLGFENVENNNPLSYNIESEINLTDPKLLGYKFLGWYSDANFKTIVESIAVGKTGDLDLYAKWEKVTYRIEYNLGADNIVNPNKITEYTIGTEYIFEKPTRDYYNFEGWYIDSKFTTKVESITKTTAASFTLYANWKPIEYKITYHLDEGTNGENPLTYTYESIITLKNPIKSGASFGGWYKDAKFNPDTKVEKIEKLSGDLNLYAKWDIITFKVTFVTEHGTAPKSIGVSNSGSKISEPPFIDYGAKFLGWYNGDTKWNFVNDIAKDNMTLTAKWAPFKYDDAIKYYETKKNNPNTIVDLHIEFDNTTQIDNFAKYTLYLKNSPKINLYASSSTEISTPNSSFGIQDTPNILINELYILDNITSIGEYTFNYTDLKKLEIKSKLKEIGNYAFSSTKLKEIILPNTLTKIGSDAFSQNDSLESVYIPKSVSTIGKDCFVYDDKLTKVIFEDEKSVWSYIDINNKPCYFFAEDGVKIKDLIFSKDNSEIANYMKKLSDFELIEFNNKLVNDVKNTLAIITNFDGNAKHIDLPNKKDKTVITWDSNSPLIDVSTGTVSHDSNNTSDTVTLTATIKRGEAVVTKQFEVRIIHKQLTPEEVLNEACNSVKIENIESYFIDSYQNKTLKAEIPLIKEIDVFGNKVSVSWSTQNNNEQVKINNNKLLLTKDFIDINQDVIAKLSFGGTSKDKIINLCLPKITEYNVYGISYSFSDTTFIYKSSSKQKKYEYSNIDCQNKKIALKLIEDSAQGNVGTANQKHIVYNYKIGADYIVFFLPYDKNKPWDEQDGFYYQDGGNKMNLKSKTILYRWNWIDNGHFNYRVNKNSKELYDVGRGDSDSTTYETYKFEISPDFQNLKLTSTTESEHKFDFTYKERDILTDECFF